MKDGCRVKICGITSAEDALMAAGEGADYLGMLVDVSFSPRSLTIEEAAPVFAAAPVPAVALVHQMAPEQLEEIVLNLKPYAVQFLSPDGPDLAGRLKKLRSDLQVWQSLFLPARGEVGEEFGEGAIMCQVWRGKDTGVDAVLFDTVAVRDGQARFGGTGCVGNWDAAARLVRYSPLPAFLAGGIGPGNVQEAIEKVRPFGVDLCSGVEECKGKKSLAKVKSLMEAVRQAEEINKQ